ncbi:MAG: trypsin-like peptidase domain-containing protein [Pyrinomonadaceae bacterium]
MSFNFYNNIPRFAAILILTFGIACGVVVAQPERQLPSFAEITKRVEPAVVTIDTKTGMTQPVAKNTPAPGTPDDVMEFLRRQMQQRPVYAVGSGFIVDKAGYVITNLHVVDNASRVTVKLDSGEEFPAKVVGSDEETDLAVLKIDAGHDLPFIKFGDSDKAEVGDWVLAIGAPFGLIKSVTAGIISQTLRETPGASAFQKFIQTDAAINRGNSGGPLVNLAGDVIGVNSQIATSTGDYNGVGFALPAREAQFVYGQILKNGKVRRGYLGAYLDSVKAEFAKVYGLVDTRGAIVTDIRDRQSPAALAGLQIGDVITTFNGQQIQSSQDLIAKVAITPPDQTVTIGYLRENGTNLDPKTVSTKLAERPVQDRTADDGTRRKLPIDGTITDQKPFGLTLSELTPALAATYKLEGQKGLVVKEINPASFIADVRNSLGNEALGEGDLIQRINRISVTDLKAFTAMVAKFKVGDPVVLQVITYNPVLRGTQTKIVQFTVK